MREPKTVAESCQELSDLLEEISVSTTAFIRTHREARIDLRELPGELTKLKTILELLHGDLEAGIAGAQLRGRLAGQQARGGDGVRQGRGLRNCGLGGQFCSDGCQSPLHGPHAAGLGLRDDPCCPWRLLGQLHMTVYHGTDWPRKGSRGAICSPLHKPGCRYRGGRLSREAAVSRIKTGKLGRRSRYIGARHFSSV